MIVHHGGQAGLKYPYYPCAMLKDNPALNSPLAGEFDLVKYVVKSTGKSKVPTKVKDARVLNLVTQEINRLPQKPDKA
jgi:hypothetical protein